MDVKRYQVEHPEVIADFINCLSDSGESSFSLMEEKKKPEIEGKYLSGLGYLQQHFLSKKSNFQMASLSRTFFPFFRQQHVVLHTFHPSFHFLLSIEV